MGGDDEAKGEFADDAVRIAAGSDALLYESSNVGLSLAVPVFDPAAEGGITVQVGLTIAFAIIENAECQKRRAARPSSVSASPNRHRR